MTRFLLATTLFLCLSATAQAQYLETFSTPNKGYLLNNVNDFTGVDWTLSSWALQPPAEFGRDVDDYFQTTVAGVLESIDIDNEVCWESPLINISAAGTVSFSAGLVWNGFDEDQTGNPCVTASDLATVDYIKVQYSVDGGGYTMIPNVIGGASCATIGYASGSGGGSGSTTISQGGISGSTLKIRICVGTNTNSELVQIDNVEVPQAGVTVGCAAPTISTLVTPTGSCNPNTGAIKVTASAGTPGYNVAWSGPSSGNPAGTEIGSSGGMYTITPLAAGTYTITVTDAASCTATTSVAVTTAAALSLSTQVLDATCSSVDDGEIDLSVSNGVPPYTYMWSNLPGSPDPQDQTDLAPGTYTVTVTDNAGCTATIGATVGISAPGAYLETFSIANKGYLPNFIDDFAGVNWTMSSWTIAAFGRQSEDFFRTSGGALVGQDFDEEVCWTSPVIDIDPPGSGIAFSVDLAWTGFDNDPFDYINVNYSLDGGGYTTVPNAVGGGAGTIQYNSGGNNDGSTTISVSALSGSSLQIQVCGNFSSDLETMTIDNVSVPGSNGLFCPCPTITFTGTPTSTCSGTSNGQIVVSGVSGGTGPYMYSKDNGVSYQSGATFTGLAATTYQVVVKDANGCTSGATPVIVGSLPLPTAAISGTLSFCTSSSTTLTASGAGGGGSYLWDDASTNAMRNITAGGTYTVQVTDNNGCTDTETATVTENSLPTVTCPGDITVCAGSATFALTGGSPGGGSYSGPGVSAGMFDPVIAGVGTHEITYAYTDGNGCSGSCTFDITVENCNIDFSGKIIWENDDVSGVKDATVKLTGSSTMSTLTDVNGDFLIMTGLTSGSFTLKPTKNSNKFNGVTVGDALAVQQHVTFINLITDPYKLVCADVNKNNNINTLDASLIQQSLLGNPAANAQFQSSWRFVPSSHTMTNPPWGFPEQRTYTAIVTSQTNQDFIGMKIGDVSGDANPANFGGGQTMVLRVNDKILKSGETIDLAFAADQMDDLAAFQFGLSFDPAALQFVDLQTLTGLPITADNFGLYNVSAGEIRTVWAQATGIAVSEANPIFQLRFTALQSGAKLSDLLQLNDAVLPGRAYTSQLEESLVELRYGATSGTIDPILNLLALQVQPNPFRAETTVSFTLPEACEAQLRVFDVNGRELLRMNNAYSAGNNSEVLRLEGVSTSGVLTCELVTPFGVATRRIVKAN